MKHDPTTEEGRAAIKKSLEKLKPDLEHLKELAEENVDDEPSGKLTNPSEIQVKRMTKRHEDR